jgi:hypothetical protein
MSLAQKSSRNSRNDLKTCEIGLGGRDRLDFGTVRPRVQIPGPRPKLALRLVKHAALKVKSRGWFESFSAHHRRSITRTGIVEVAKRV